ncbi:DUF3363 domain-containing protein [Bradyrhizobium sp. UFLA05-112]
MPWQPLLEKRIGQHISGLQRDDGGIEWTFGRNRGSACSAASERRLQPSIGPDRRRPELVVQLTGSKQSASLLRQRVAGADGARSTIG